jgi:hypothetical protein
MWQKLRERMTENVVTWAAVRAAVVETIASEDDDVRGEGLILLG